MNEGIKIAKGAYVIFLNSDDYWKQGVMLNYIKYIQKTHDQDVYYARFCVRSNDIIT
ncbi:glycosyltransferase [bacterium]|nr:glycosyltransferase [bacterium]